MNNSVEDFIEESTRESKILTSDYFFTLPSQILGDMDEEVKEAPPFSFQIQPLENNEIMISLEMPASNSDILSFSRLPNDIRSGIIKILEKRINEVGIQTSSNT